jgi:septal ring factor EnvC (AmiA/AmiB activator)
LIADWKAKKRKDPRIVGRWTRKMQQRLKEEKKAKAGGKRKREGSNWSEHEVFGSQVGSHALPVAGSIPSH